MTLKIQCTYVAEGESFTLGRKYDIYCADGGMFYIKDDCGVNLPYRDDGDTPVIDGLLETLHANYHSHFSPCFTIEQVSEPEKDIKKEVHNLLDKVTELIYDNQEELKIDYMDLITLVKIKEELKWKEYILD